MENEKLVFDSPEAVMQSYNTGNKQQDLKVINALLAGNVDIKLPDAPKPESEITNGSQEIETGTEKIEPVADDSKTSEIVNQPILDEESERIRKYNEFLEQKHREEHDKHLVELKKREDELKQERLAKEELEKRIQQLQDLKREQPSTEMLTQQDINEEDQYASEYNKRTRQMVEDLRSQVGNNPVVQDLVGRIDSIQKDYETQKQEALKLQQEKQRKEQENKVYDSIRQFQTQYPELRTQKDIKDIEGDYLKFRRDIGYLVNAQSPIDVDRALLDYRRGGKTRELAAQKGIQASDDLEKYNAIADLIDQKNGFQRDPITGEDRPILDEFGNRVRYRSLDEVYKISRYYDDLSKVRKESFKEVSQKLETINQAPVTLKPEQTGTPITGLSLEQEQEILNWNPKIWSNDPEKRRLVELVYTKRGLEVPRYRGRKI